MTQNRRTNRSHIKNIFFFLTILFFSLSLKQNFSSSHFLTIYWKIINKIFRKYSVQNWTLISSNMLPLCINLLSFISIIYHALKRISKKKNEIKESKWERKKKNGKFSHLQSIGSQLFIIFVYIFIDTYFSHTQQPFSFTYISFDVS